MQQQRSHCLLIVTVCALVSAAAAPVWLWPPGSDIRTEDQNHDGRPDVWREYDRQGQLARVSVDTNFDGRSDVQEYYERSALVRRESDRDFNDRVDLVQEFDATTREAVRSVADVDFDGSADLLVLFQGGQPVSSQWAHHSTPGAVGADAAPHAQASQRTADAALAPLEDPFRNDLSARAVRSAAASGDCVGLSTSGGLPASCSDDVSPLASSSGVSGSRVSHPSSAIVLPYSPRGPPAAHLTT